MTRGTRIAGLALAGAFALAACSETPTPTPTQSSSTPVPTSTMTSVTPSPTPTEDPKVAAGKALIAKYFETYNAAVKSGDTAEHRKTFTNDCGLCLSSAQTIDQIAAKGNRIEGGAFSVSDISVVDPKHLSIQARLQQASAKIQNSSGKVLQRYPATKASYSVFQFETVGGVLKINRIVA